MCVVGVCLVRFLICSWPCMFLMVCVYSDDMMYMCMLYAYVFYQVCHAVPVVCCECIVG